MDLDLLSTGNKKLLLSERQPTHGDVVDSLPVLPFLLECQPLLLQLLLQLLQPGRGDMGLLGQWIRIQEGKNFK